MYVAIHVLYIVYVSTFYDVWHICSYIYAISIFHFLFPFCLIQLYILNTTIFIKHCYSWYFWLVLANGTIIKQVQ